MYCFLNNLLVFLCIEFSLAYNLFDKIKRYIQVMRKMTVKAIFMIAILAIVKGQLIKPAPETMVVPAAAQNNHIPSESQ